jgi:vancomycin resistance protein YoaR
MPPMDTRPPHDLVRDASGDLTAADEPRADTRGRRWRRSGSMKRHPRTIALIVVVALLSAWLLAWGIGTATANGDSAPNLRVGDADVGGLSPADLRVRLDELADDWSDAPVEVVTPAGTADATADEVGLTLDVEATAAAVDTADEQGFPLLRPVRWLLSWVSPIDVTPVFSVDTAQLEASPVGEVIAANAVAPVEPGLQADGASVSAVPGVDGEGISLERTADALTGAATVTGSGTVQVTLRPTPVPPTYTLADARDLAEQTNRLLDDPIIVKVGEASASVDSLEYASWLTTAAGPDALALAVDQERLVNGVSEALGDVTRPETPVGFVVVDGKVSTTPGVPPAKCCAATAGEQVLDALVTPGRTAVLDLEPLPAAKGPEWAASLGIVEPIATFTTQFPAGQSRAINIIRVAEIVRGAVIEPGGTFSVNGHTGPRGLAQGFVDGGIIVNGVVVNGVGGGISQFATTLFNAAFFAGLDIPDYFMHTLYISRYPYGREATLAWPSVDLKVTDNTPHGVLIWPTWTDSSITVTLYSSPWIRGEQTGQTTEPAGACTRVTTERTRTWILDGRTERDYFYARYQPEEGVLC